MFGAVGRRAWLFSDTPQGAHASATCYSLIETAKANQLEPYGYIKYLLDHIGAADTLEKLETLLPWQVPMEAFSKKVNVFDGAIGGFKGAYQGPMSGRYGRHGGVGRS